MSLTRCPPTRKTKPAEIKLSPTPRFQRAVHLFHLRLVEGLVDRILRPRVNDSTKEVFTKFTAVSVIQDRAKFGTDVHQAVIKIVKAMTW
ncbi:MAG: hypothetical protein R3E61_09295 [Pseudomonadales bacterium]